MDKLKMQSLDVIGTNVQRFALLFPNCVTEHLGKDGKTELGVDFEKLQAELSNDIIAEGAERYQFTWPDKRAAVRLANAPTTMTLRPCKEESLNFDNTQNVYIEGDNLEVLKILQETYLKKIDVIYIDPPYNTGKNLIYKNDFSIGCDDYLYNSGQYDIEGNRLVLNSESNGRFHTDWLNMIYTRLKVAKNLLSDKGIIVVTIDDYEIETITMLMNEIFGEANHLATIVIKNNPSGRSTVSGASISHEYALFYGANEQVKLGRLPRNDKQIARYKERDEVGPFEWVNFRKHGGYKEDAPTMFYPIYIKSDGSSFRIPKMKWNNDSNEYDVLDDIKSDEFLSYPIDENGRSRRWKWSLERALKESNDMCIRLDRDKKPAVYIKSRMKEEGMLPLTVWDDKLYSSTEYGTNYLISLLGKRYFDYPKSIYAVIDCLRVADCSDNSLVLDFFSGSATTAHAVMKLNEEDGGNRKFIMVQLPEKTDESSEAYKDGYKNICEIGKERIRRAGAMLMHNSQCIIHNEKCKMKECENYELCIKNCALDTGFRVLKLDTSNMEDVYYTPQEFELQSLFNENVKADRTNEDLLFQVMLDLGIELSAKIESKQIAGKNVHFVDDNYLVACFDRDLNESTITEIAKLQPIYFVMRDASAANDNVIDNFEQIFKHYSPDTVCRII